MKHRFPKGHKFGKGGRQNPPGGRPTNAQIAEREKKKEITRLAGELAKKYLEDYLRPILDAYKVAAAGVILTKKGKLRKARLDLATCRHAVERFVPPATRTLSIELQKTAEDFYEEIMREAGVDPHQDKDGQKQIEPPKDETIH